MKCYLFAAMVVASGFMFTGCANEPATATKASAANPTDRTYTRDDLQKTGRTQTGEAVQALDPAVTTSSGGRR
jgi:PBP1b-binding outer membrane lipoprotein LpoB